jgi:hypothetical protein
MMNVEKGTTWDHVSRFIGEHILQECVEGWREILKCLRIVGLPEKVRK